MSQSMEPLLDSPVKKEQQKIEPLVEKCLIDDNQTTLGKTGQITSAENGEFTIDNIYKFKSNSVYFNRGSIVSYNLFLEPDGQKVSNVHLIGNERKVIEDQRSKWSLRKLVCKTVHRDKRRVFTVPYENLEICLDKVASDFEPKIGDWLQLDAKCEVNEFMPDKVGEIYDILKISPLGPHIRECTVTYWDDCEQKGELDYTIHFDKDSIGTYKPVKNESVTASVIESDQNGLSMRALRVVPDFLNKNAKFFWDMVCGDVEIQVELEVDGIELIELQSLNFTSIGQKQKFQFLIVNKLDKDVVVNSITFPRPNSGCELITNCEDMQIASKRCVNIDFACTCAQNEKSTDYMLISTSEGDIGHWLEICVKGDPSEQLNNYIPQPTTYEQLTKTAVMQHRPVFSGQWFRPHNMPEYTLTQQYKDLMSEHRWNVDITKSKLGLMKPCLLHDLTVKNYMDRMHSLLYFEEIQHIMNMSRFDQENTILTPKGDYLAWRIENFLERRPTLMPGDSVYLEDPYDGKKLWEGYVGKTKSDYVYLKFSDDFHENYNGEGYNIHVASSRTSKRRQHLALDLAIEYHGINLLFPSKLQLKKPQVFLDKPILSSEDESRIKSQSSIEKTTDYSNTIIIKWYNKDLNRYQKEAVLNVLQGEARPLPYVIFGPPGTGKTVTLVECILQILHWIPSSRILMTAPSNSAANRMALKLIESKVLKPGHLVRFVSNRHLPKMTAELAPYCIDGNMARNRTGTHNVMLNENEVILVANERDLGRHRVIITTCSSAATLYVMDLPSNHFSHIVVDEAGQASEPEILIPMAFLRPLTGQAILAGDPMQLGPVVISSIAKQCGLQTSYLERLLNRFPYSKDTQGFPQTNGYHPKLITKLLYNYRSLPNLLELTSSLFYDNDLIPMLSKDAERSKELLNKIEQVVGTNSTGKTNNIVFHGIVGDAYHGVDTPSWFNPTEIRQVFSYVKALYNVGVNKKDIGIISPYIKQVREIRKKFVMAKLEVPKIGSIEEFQGQEFSVIILSTVRSTKESTTAKITSSLRFISDPRRLNVALSRAKVFLIIIGNPDLLVHDVYWRKILNYVVRNGINLGSPISYKK